MTVCFLSCVVENRFYMIQISQNGAIWAIILGVCSWMDSLSDLYFA